MMWQEFEELAGYEVSYKDYHEIIEPMYMAVPNVSKQEFVKMIDKKRFALKTKAEIIREMKKIAKHLYETCEHYTDWDAKNRIEELRAEYSNRFAGGEYCYIETETTLPNQRGCSFPVALVEVSDWNSSYDIKTNLLKRPA